MEYLNVIGFRLIKATLQNLLYQVHINYKVYFTYGGTDKIATLTIMQSYTNTALAKLQRLE